MSREETTRALFDAHYEKLVEFRGTHDYWPRQRNTQGVEHELAVWFLDIRKKYRSNTLPRYAVEKLERINFPFNPSEFRWYDTYDKVKKHINEYKKFPDSKSPKLYSWLRRQMYVWNSLTTSQRSALREIGLGYRIKLIQKYGSLRESCWETKFERLKAYYKKHKKIPVSWGSDPNSEEFALGLWCTSQRSLYALGRLSEYREKKLNSLNFFELTDRNRKWNNMYAQLCAYVQKHKKFPTTGYLSVWCSYNRSWYNGKLPGTYGKYPEDRKKKLDAIGFRWEQCL